MALNRKALAKEIGQFLGPDFIYFFDTDYIGNQVGTEDEKSLITFKYRPNKKPRPEESVVKRNFKEKVEQLIDKYPYLDVDGIKTSYDGYIISIVNNSLEKLGSILDDNEREYITKREGILRRIDALKTKLGV